MRDRRSIYLNTISIPEAVEKLKKVVNIGLKEEIISTENGLHRITSRAIYAKYSSPTFHSAAMDGICVRADQTFGAREGSPIKLKKGKDFLYVNTGDPLPPGFNAVIMIEYVQEIDEDHVSIEKSAYPYEHVRRIGEDIVATEMILPPNHMITPYDIGALLSAGIFEIFVKEKIRISIIPTGDEVLNFEKRMPPSKGEVIESNSMMLGAMAKKWGCIVKRVPPVKDNLEEISNAIRKELESNSHIVVVIAGSSAGNKDYSRRAMERFGEILVHGISAMPGKPSILGYSEKYNKLMVGAPGYPVSAVICFDKLVKPLVYHLFSYPVPEREKIKVVLTKRLPSKLGQREFVRVAISRVGDKYVANPMKRGASLITSLTNAHGIIEIPENIEGIKENTQIEAELIVNRALIENSLMCVGSHDNILDLLANELMKRQNPIKLSSSHVGSVGGLVTLNRGCCHFAGSHLYDPKSGDYNFPFIEKYIKKEVVVINLAIRHQGFIVRKNNPKNIRSVHDLLREDVVFINRQKGAGTRILFDDLLKKHGIPPEKIKGYNTEEYTHMGVGVNVLSGAADVGMGIFAAAKALGLDFIPVTRERYDLVILKEFLDDSKIQAIIDTIRDKSFKQKIKSLGGYEVSLTGLFMEKGMGLGKI